MNPPLWERRSVWPRWARGITHKAVVIPVTILTGLVLAFITYGFITRLGPTKFSRGGSYGLPSPVGGGATGANPTGKKGHASAARPKHGGRATKGGTISPPGSVGSGGVASPPAPSGGSGPGGSAPAPSGLAAPATGTYKIAIDGTESVHFGPVSFCNRTLPTSAPLVVKDAKGEPAGSYDFDFSLSSEHQERRILRYTSDRVFLAFEGARVTCAGVAQSTEDSYQPPETRVIAPLAVGQRWNGTSSDPNRTETYTVTVTGTQTLRVAGQTVQTYVIETNIDMSGKESGHRLQRWWYAPSLGVPVKWHEEIDASRSGATYSENVTCTVEEMP